MLRTRNSLGLALGAGLALTMAGCDGTARPAGSVTIERPAAEIFPMLTEAERRREWVAGIIAIKEGGGPPRVGAKAVETLDMGGQRVTVHAEVTALEPAKLLAVKGTSEGFEMAFRYRLEEFGGKTRVDWDAEFQFKPLLAKLMMGVIAPDIQTKLEADFVRLKGIAERKKPAG
ncbi:MAG: SRPBCC family protein [Candidatus Sericytochromatia bacterium]|nr:SRPBCC family protein [Candidatus Tanganyikabacteria bacterium]